MDGGQKSNRLFPAHTRAELERMIPEAATDAAREKIRLAIRQRDPKAAEYVPAFRTPQVGRE